LRSRKDFFIGLGLGIIFVSIIWLASLQAKPEDNAVITRAKELGMVFPKDLGVPEAPFVDPAAHAGAEENFSLDTPEIPRTPLEEKIQHYTVRSGTSAKAVAVDLENLGVIEDADLFIDDLTKMQLTARIKARDYKFDITYGPLDIYTVIRELTR